MKRLRQLLTLPRASRNMLLRAVLLLWVGSLALLSMSFEGLRRRGGDLSVATKPNRPPLVS